MFTTLCFSNDFGDFEGFTMSWTGDSNSAWVHDVNSACRKKTSSYKRYEISKWSFGNAILVIDWNTVHWHIAPYW